MLSKRTIKRKKNTVALHQKTTSEIHESGDYLSEKVLSEGEIKFRNLIDLLPHIVFDIDAQGKFIFISSNAHEILGFRIDELINNMDIFQLLAPADRKKLKKILNFGNTKGIYSNNHYQVICKNGSLFPVIMNIMPISTNNRVNGWRGVIIDITERTLSEQKRRELEQKAVVSSHLASIGELASGIAHEVNNPLASIVLYSQLLIEEKLPDNIKRDVLSIYESAIRATNIIRRLLTFARQQLQKRIPVNVNDIVEVTLELRKYALETSSIQAKTELDRDLPLTMADAVQLQEVFLNIILNAETEMKLAHGRGELAIKTEIIDNYIRVSFKDNGPGIAMENIDKIFNPFFTTRQVGEGTGLGLSICHGIIIEHGGRIYAESEQGNGATFIIELPIVTKLLIPEQTDMSEVKIKKLKKYKILVIDDEIGILDSLSRIIAKHGHKVEITDNCLDAIEMIRDKRYDYILLDVKLPGMSGIELFRQLQNEDNSIVNRLAIITGDTMEPETQNFLEYAKVPCFVKPFDTKNFIRELNYLIDKNQ